LPYGRVMARATPLTYSGALAILGRHSPVVVEVLDRVAGAGILLGAIVHPPALGMVDGKQEAGRLVRDLLSPVLERVRGTHGRSRHDLIAAAHTTIVVAALFDALRQTLGPLYDQLKVTDAEKLRLATARGDLISQSGWVDQLADADLPLPSPTGGFEENLNDRLAPRVAGLADSALAFFEGLRAWSRSTNAGDVVPRIVARWRELYRELYLRLSSDVPEFFVWASFGEHAATRDELRRINLRLSEVLDRASEAMGKLHDILVAGATVDRPRRGTIRAGLARTAAAVLDQPLLRSSKPPGGISLPSVAGGFVTPRFRYAVASGPSPAAMSQEQWWADRPTRDGLDVFLAACLAHPDSARLPLVVLGHPGAGKSLLSEILAARLPSERFAVVPVQLRRVNADDRLLVQVETALHDILHEQVSWGALAEESADVTRVVILDGFDELIQATGTTQSSYLTEAARFQAEELALGRSVAVIVTSRTIVLDRARVPDGSLVIKLEEFSDEQIEQWLTAWNRANVRTARFRKLTTTEILRHGALARQPLLLTLLSIYHADPSAARIDADGMSTATLYRMLLDNFIHRQVADKPDRTPGEEELPRLLGDARWRLSIAAFAMFNRRRQYVGDHDLERDLEVFLGRERDPAQGFDRPAERARRTVAGFFFVHVARADEHTDQARRTYEFLHATFSEYLIAERALILLDGYAQRRELYQSDPSAHEAPDDSMLRAMLSYQPLSLRRQIVEFARGLVTHYPATRLPAMRKAALALLAQARLRAFGRLDYEPVPPDVVDAAAAYTANLTILRLLLSADKIVLDSLAPPGTDVRRWWRSTVRLWQAGLDDEAWESMENILGIGRLTLSASVRDRKPINVSGLELNLGSLP